jgi:hypothetical protein
MKEQDRLDEAFGRLQALLPGRFRSTLRWLHSPRSRPVRIPLGVLFILCSFLWFMPVVGIEFFPIGLLLIAQDVAVLRRPTGVLINGLIDLFERLRERYRAWRRRRHGN